MGTLISFRVDPGDAAVLGKEFSPEFSASDLMGLPNYRIYLRLMIDGMVSRPFSAETLAPWITCGLRAEAGDLNGIQRHSRDRVH